MRLQFLSTLIWCCTLGTVGAEVTAVPPQNITPAPVGHPEIALNLARPSCVISISDNEANVLSQLVNRFSNIFSDTSRTVNTFHDANSPFVMNCETGIAQLETSVWLILSRAWLTTSCEFSDQDLDRGIHEIENEGSKMLLILESLKSKPNTAQPADFYDNMATTVRATLKEAVAKIRSTRTAMQCQSSTRAKELTKSFELALREISSQREVTATLHQETNQAIRAIKSQSEEFYKVLQASTLLRNRETGNALHAATPQNVTLFNLEFSKNGMTEAATPDAPTTTTDQADSKQLNPTEVHASADVNSPLAPITKPRPSVAPSAALQSYLSSGFPALSGRLLNIENEYYRGEYLYLARNPTDRYGNLYWDGATLPIAEEGLSESAWLWDLVPVPGGNSSYFYLRNKLNHHRPIPSKENYYAKEDFIVLRVDSGGPHPNKLVIYIIHERGRYYQPYHELSEKLNGREVGPFSSSRRGRGTKWIVTFASLNERLDEGDSKNFSSANTPPLQVSSTEAPAPPPTALQSYINSGFLAGVSGRLVNIENADYKGEFLRLVEPDPGPFNRTSCIYLDGTTLAVGEERLRESEWLWEFIPIPGNDSSLFYLRNKLNEHKPIPSKEDGYGGHNYVQVELVPVYYPDHPRQVVIRMTDTAYGAWYYLTKYSSSLRERAVLTRTSYTEGMNWIVSFPPLVNKEN